MSSYKNAEAMKMFIDKTLPDLLADVAFASVPKVVLTIRYTELRWQDAEEAVLRIQGNGVDHLTV